MKELLVGIPALFLFICFAWTVLYELGEESEPPIIMGIIGYIEIAIFCISIILGFAYFIGYCILNC